MPFRLRFRTGLSNGSGRATPGIGWRLPAYAVITAAEVLVSITCLEFPYTRASMNMKSLVMYCSSWLRSITARRLTFGKSQDEHVPMICLRKSGGIDRVHAKF